MPFVFCCGFNRHTRQRALCARESVEPSGSALPAWRTYRTNHLRLASCRWPCRALTRPLRFPRLRSFTRGEHFGRFPSESCGAVTSPDLDAYSGQHSAIPYGCRAKSLRFFRVSQDDLTESHRQGVTPTSVLSHRYFPFSLRRPPFRRAKSKLSLPLLASGLFAIHTFQHRNPCRSLAGTTRKPALLFAVADINEAIPRDLHRSGLAHQCR